MPVISPQLTFADTLGSWKARWGIGRMSYLVPPGLYAIGAPDSASPVVVTANYKMTYDLVRSALKGRNLWLLVLETYGINVWCAAGKGTFGTGELVRRIEACGLGAMVAHRELLLPIMGAAGVKGIEVKKRTGFNCRFATLRINDLPGYLDAGMQATREMRELTFSLKERLVLTPVELVSSLQTALYALPLLFIGAATGSAGFNLVNGCHAVIVCLAAILSGALLSPLLLPWLPTRSFAVKGAITGALVSAALVYHLKLATTVSVMAVLLSVTAISSFAMLNFTGSTPFTSRSGVKFEMRRALPLQGGALAVAVAAALVWRLM
ncbi:MAG: acetyl-CoA synthase subunit gamma [Geobacter sp.]|nr:acetyl-CoA synthase subunit gamma [Geobacter sp.]